MIGRLLLGLWLVCAAHETVARADASPYLGRDNPLAALLPSAAVRAARETARRERYIERELASLAHVARAEVLLTEAPRETAALDHAAPKPRASVRLEVSAGAPSDAEIMRIVRAALPELLPEHVHISRSRQRDPAHAVGVPTARVGPFVVAEESSTPLRMTLALCLGANVLLAALLLARRRAR